MLGHKFKMYVVIDVRTQRPVTYVNSYNDGFEYVNRLIYIDRREHFKCWCNLNHLEFNEKDINSWKECWKQYIYNCLDEDDFREFQIARFTCDTRGVAEVLRAADDCIPLGCSFESDYEKSIYKEAIEKLNSNFEEQNEEEDVQ